MPAWITLKKVEGEFLGSARQIAAGLGEVLGGDRRNAVTEDQRFCVTLTSGAPYEQFLGVTNPITGERSVIVVDYNHLPIRCRMCLAIDHLIKDCPVINNKPGSRGDGSRSGSQLEVGEIAAEEPESAVIKDAGHGAGSRVQVIITPVTRTSPTSNQRAPGAVDPPVAQGSSASGRIASSAQGIERQRTPSASQNSGASASRESGSHQGAPSGATESEHTDLPMPGPHGQDGFTRIKRNEVPLDQFIKVRRAGSGSMQAGALASENKCHG